MTILDQLKHDPVRHAWTISDIGNLCGNMQIKAIIEELVILAQEGYLIAENGLYHLTEKAWEEIK